MINMIFERETKYGVYRDAIILPDDHGFSQADLDAMMQQRVDNWIAIIENPPQPDPIPEFIEVDGIKYQRVQ